MVTPAPNGQSIRGGTVKLDVSMSEPEAHIVRVVLERCPQLRLKWEGLRGSHASSGSVNFYAYPHSQKFESTPRVRIKHLRAVLRVTGHRESLDARSLPTKLAKRRTSRKLLLSQASERGAHVNDEPLLSAEEIAEGKARRAAAERRHEEQLSRLLCALDDQVKTPPPLPPPRPAPPPPPPPPRPAPSHSTPSHRAAP